MFKIIAIIFHETSRFYRAIYQAADEFHFEGMPCLLSRSSCPAISSGLHRSNEGAYPTNRAASTETGRNEETSGEHAVCYVVPRPRLSAISFYQKQRVI